jgi:hypothetical protein
MPLSDLAVDSFLLLREAFFNKEGSPKSFSLPDKRNAQDDPFDKYIAGILAQKITDATCLTSPGPLIGPDMVIFRQNACDEATSASLKTDITRIIGIEVKKLERSRSGQISRSTGLDYNTTPPCGTIRVYDAKDRTIDIRGFYLFVCQEPTLDGNIILSALTLCDGDILNADFSLYLQITGKRTKGVGLGTYGDGLNRNRPMLIFAIPLGAAQLDHAATLVTRSNLSQEDSRLGLVYQIGRTIPEGGQGIFYAYRTLEDIPQEWELQQLVDPFPKPVSNSATSARGKFKLPIHPVEESSTS